MSCQWTAKLFYSTPEDETYLVVSACAYIINVKFFLDEDLALDQHSDKKSCPTIPRGLFCARFLFLSVFSHMDLSPTLFPSECASVSSFSSSFFGFFVFFHERAVFSNGITSSVICDNSMYLPVRSVHNPHCDRTIPSPWYTVPSLVLLMGTFDSVLLNKLLPFCFRLFTWWLQSSF